MITADGQKKALVVGISDYTSLQTLDICKNDGTEVYKVLSSLGYEISDKNKLIGEAKGERLKDVIYDFFSGIESNPDDTLLFYYSGHGVLDIDGDIYLASSDIDPNEPYRRGFSFEELTKMIQRSTSTKVVVILDSCYSGSAKISKGNEENAAKVGRTTIEEKSKKLQGQGKYILSASQALQEAIALTTDRHSLFTHYILRLKGDPKSIDNEGNVTPESLGMYAYREIMSLPADKRSKQKPLTRADGSANIVLASYPKLKSLKIEDIREDIRASMLKLLRESKVQEFNNMREDNSAILSMPDFSMENLHGVHIAGANLSNANLKRVNLTAADLEGANLSNANLFRTDLEGANLSKTNFSKAFLEDSDLSHANLTRANLSHTNLTRANLSHANLTRANLSHANLTRANLSHANIFSADLQQAKLIDADLRGTNLSEANLIGADLTGAAHKGNLGSKNKIWIAILAAVIVVVLSLALFIHYNHSSTNNKYALNSKGLALNNLGNYTGAIIYYDKALALDPNYKDALTNKGRALDNLGNHTGAIIYLDKALALDPNYKDALTNKGRALDSLGDYTGAIIYYDKALRIDPNYKYALSNKGNALIGLGNYTQAILYLDKALDIDPNYNYASSLKKLAQSILHNTPILHVHNITQNP